MTKRILALFLGGLICLAQGADKPNIILIMADDLGWGDLGCQGSLHIQTPHIDSLAREGTRFTRHYAGQAVCAPSRCVLLTGKHPGHAAIRDNQQAKKEVNLGDTEGQVPLPANELTLGEILQKEGYATGCFGKWGLGMFDTEGSPLKQGFDRFHGYNCQAHAHWFWTPYLWNDDRREPLDNPDKMAVFGKAYSADVITEQALAWMRAKKGQPFFLYFASTIPHVSLQVPEDSLREYLGRFPEIPFAGQHYSGHPTPRAAYAAMVSRLDKQVGQLIALTRELGLEERTIFVFTSDNGPAPQARPGEPGAGGSDSAFFQSAGPFRGLKGSLYEGGVRVPMIATWKGQLPVGRVVTRATGHEDLLPTLLDLAGIASREGLDGISFAATLRGQSQNERPFLYREFPSYGGQQAIWQGDWKATRQNLIPPKNAEPKKDAGAWELYRLADDPNESKNLAKEQPEILQRLAGLAREQHVNSALFPFPALDQ